MEFLADTLILQSKDKLNRFVLNAQTISKVEYRDNDDTVIIRSLDEIIIGRAIRKSKGEWIYTLEVYPSASSKEPRLKLEMTEEDDIRLIDYLKKYDFGPDSRSQR